MDRAYTICMIVGIGIPLLSLVLGSIFDFLDGIFDGIANIFDGLDLDFDFGFDLGDFHIALLPISFQSICAGVLIFGTVGKLTFTGTNYLFANVVAGVSGYVAALAVQTLINKLKKVEHKAKSKEELMYCDTMVTNTILAGGFGAVRIKTEDGSLSYPAKALDNSETIKQDTPVYIIRFEKNVAIVKKARHAEKLEDLIKYD